MTQEITLQEVSLSSWTDLVNKGATNAVMGLSQMLNEDIKITCLNLKAVSTVEAFDIFGGAETVVVGIYLMITEGAAGHILLVYPPDVAYGLVDMLMENEVGVTQEMGELEESALAEVGNIVGSFFLNSMADNTGIRFQPSPPQVMLDMAGAILNIVLSDIMQYGDDIFIMETIFDSKDKRVNGALLVLPSGDFMSVMQKHSQQYGKVSWT